MRSSRRRRLSAAHPGCRSNRPRHYGGEGLLRSSSSSWTSLSSSQDLRAGTAARSSRFNGSSSRLAGRDGDAGDNLDLVGQSEDEAAAAAEAGAAGGWQGWVHGAVAKVKEALPEPSEAKKILPLGLMLFFILFDYTILRDTKVQACYFLVFLPLRLSCSHQLAPLSMMCVFLSVCFGSLETVRLQPKYLSYFRLSAEPGKKFRTGGGVRCFESQP